MNLSERGKAIGRKAFLVSALLSPLQASSAQAESTTLLPVNTDQLSSLVQETVKTELPYTEDSSKWTVAASYTSDFTRSEPYREHNIIAASNGLNNYFWDFKEIDGKLVKYGKNFIKPGETFSINSVLGKVDDYVIGYAIGDDLQPVPVNGGGICQVSTTMLVVSLIGGLYIDERFNHVYYFGCFVGDPKDSKEMGKDATIYIPDLDTERSLDLVVKNTYDYPIRYFFEKVDGQHLRAGIYGPPEIKPYYVEIDGPTMVYPFEGALVKDNAACYTGAAKTTLTQSVWKNSSKGEQLFVPRILESTYRAAPKL